MEASTTLDKPREEDPKELVTSPEARVQKRGKLFKGT